MGGWYLLALVTLESLKRAARGLFHHWPLQLSRNLSGVKDVCIKGVRVLGVIDLVKPRRTVRLTGLLRRLVEAAA